MPRHFEHEDGPEDTGNAPVSGHNGSLQPYVHQESKAVPCPGMLRSHLAVLKAELRGQAQARAAKFGDIVRAS